MSGGPPRGSYSNAGRGSYDNGRSNGPNYSDGGAGGRGGRPAMNSQANSGNNYDNRGQYGGGNRNNQEYWPQDQGPRQDNQRYNDQSYQQNGPPQQYGNSGRSYNSGRPPRDQQNGPQQNFQDRYRGDNQEYNDRSSRNYDRQPPSNQHRGGYSQGPQQNQRGGYNDNCQRQPQNFQNQRGDQDHRQSSNYQQDRAPRGMGRPNQYNNGPNQDNYQYGNGPNQQQYRNADNDYRQRNQGNDRRYEEGPTFGGPQQPYFGNDDSSNNFQQSRGPERSTRGGYSGPGGRGGSTFGGNSGRGGTSFGGRGGSNCGSRDDYRSGGYSNASSGYNNGGGGGSRYESRFESRLASRDGNSRGGGDDSRAPVNFRPEIRAVDDIFREDAELAQRDGCRLDEDADVDIEETNEKLITEQWSEMDLHPKVCENIMKSGYIRPRKVQQFTIPYVLSGYDCKVQCETGSGKTAAFCVPIISNLAKGFDDGSIHSIPDSPLALVIAPTRELASQLYDQAKKFAVGTKVSVAVAYGQYALRQNIADLKAGCHVVCATLGRLLQLIKEERIRLNELKYLVIDEADRLLVENSREELMELINFPTMPKERQTLLFSATLEDYAVTNFARNYMNCNLMVKITANAKSNRRLKYEIYAVRDDRAKHQAILAYLKKISPGNNIPRVLIFVNKKIDTDRVATSLTVKGYGATTIHGDRGQHLREEAMRSFRSGKTKILVATDVCARGVDIHDLDYVVNFDIPNGDSTFVQRCGRTGRTHEGVAASFYLEYSDRSYAETIAMVMEAAGQNPPEFLRSGVHEEDFKLLEEEHEQDEQSGNPQPPAAPTENVREEDSGWD